MEAEELLSQLQDYSCSLLKCAKGKEGTMLPSEVLPRHDDVFPLLWVSVAAYYMHRKPVPRQGWRTSNC